ncbi:MAG: archease [Candidatus Bipolaricaulia bacterium]
MPFEYKEHTGEAWLVGIGETLEEAFAEGAKALFQLMVDVERVQSSESTRIDVRSDRLDTLFVAWLNALIVRKDVDGLVYGEFESLDVQQTNPDDYRLTAIAWGEPLDPGRHDPKVDVKAATYSELRCEQTERGSEVECVVDL